MKPTIQRRMSRRSLINAGGVAFGVYWAAICLLNSQPVELSTAAVDLQKCQTAFRLSETSVRLAMQGDALGAAVCSNLIIQLDPDLMQTVRNLTGPNEWGITYHHIRGRWSPGHG